MRRRKGLHLELTICDICTSLFVGHCVNLSFVQDGKVVSAAHLSQTAPVQPTHWEQVTRPFMHVHADSFAVSQR